MSHYINKGSEIAEHVLVYDNDDNMPHGMGAHSSLNIESSAKLIADLGRNASSEARQRAHDRAMELLAIPAGQSLQA